MEIKLQISMSWIHGFCFCWILCTEQSQQVYKPSWPVMATLIQLDHNSSDCWLYSGWDQILMSRMVNGLMIKISGKKIKQNFDSNDTISTQFCTCHDSLAIMACAKLWNDWIIICQSSTICFSRDLDYELINSLWNVSLSTINHHCMITHNWPARIWHQRWQ